MNVYRTIPLSEQALALGGVAIDLYEDMRDHALGAGGARLERALARADRRWPRAARWKRDALSVGERPLAHVAVGPSCILVNTRDGGCVAYAEQDLDIWTVHRSDLDRRIFRGRARAIADLKAACDELGLEVSGWEDVR